MGECLNLRAEIARKKLEIKSMAKELGMSEKSLRNKILGITDFTWSEAQLIHEMYFPHLDKDMLLAREESA